jgi:hypothetical protein
MGGATQSAEELMIQNDEEAARTDWLTARIAVVMEVIGILSARTDQATQQQIDKVLEAWIVDPETFVPGVRPHETICASVDMKNIISAGRDH